MVIKTASPGIVVNEVDLTRGTSDAITTNIAAFAGPLRRVPSMNLPSSKLKRNCNKSSVTPPTKTTNTGTLSPTSWSTAVFATSSVATTP